MTSRWAPAKEIELQGRLLYERLARNAHREDLATVFSLLAKEERRHWELFDHLENSLPPEMVGEDEPHVDLASVVASLASEDGEEDDVGLETMRDAAYAYTRALVLEQKSIEYYSGLLETAGNGNSRALTVVLREERRHAEFMEALLQFVLRPKQSVRTPISFTWQIAERVRPQPAAARARRR